MMNFFFLRIEKQDCVAGPSGIVSSKKKKKKSYFEGEFVPFLVSSKKSKRKKGEDEDESIENVQDEYVLQKLFSRAGMIISIVDINFSKTIKCTYLIFLLFFFSILYNSGICSALQHDTIMEGGPADFAIVEQEAQKIAEQAVDELKKSQKQCFPAQSGIPNWTGKYGGISK